MSVQEATLTINDVRLDYLSSDKGVMQVLYAYSNPSILDISVAVTAELYRAGLRVWQKDLIIILGDGRTYPSRSMKFYWSSAYVPSTALHPDTDYLFTIFFHNNTGIYQTRGLDFHTPAVGQPPVGTIPPPPVEPPPEGGSILAGNTKWIIIAIGAALLLGGAGIAKRLKRLGK